MKLSEIKGEKALDVIADLLDPISEIVGDKEIEKAYNEHKSYMDIIKMAIKNHKKAIITICALLDCEDPETYEISLVTLPKKIKEIIEDEDLKFLFQSQGMKTGDASSFSAYPNTTE